MSSVNSLIILQKVWLCLACPWYRLNWTGHKSDSSLSRTTCWDQFKSTIVKFLNIRTSENFAVIYLKFRKRDQTSGYLVKKMQIVCSFGLRLYVPVNNFSVMSRWSHRFQGITSTFFGGKCILLKDTTRRPEWGLNPSRSGVWHSTIRQKDVNEIGAVRSGSALFAQTYLSENFESLR